MQRFSSLHHPVATHFDEIARNSVRFPQTLTIGGRTGDVATGVSSGATLVSVSFTLRQSVQSDIEWLVELRAVVLRADLERLGRYDDVEVRERMRRAFRPELTRIIMVNDEPVGSITARPEGDVRWLEHFYLEPRLQGSGIGTGVLSTVLDEQHAGETHLVVLQGSPARRLYDRLGFLPYAEDGIDVLMRHAA